MSRVSLNQFKDEKILVTVTLVLAMAALFIAFLEPKYTDQKTAAAIALVTLPIYALWFHFFWNRILRKIFKIPEITYPVSLLLLAAIIVLTS